MLGLFSLQLCLFFFEKMMKFWKSICSAWISRTSAELFFLTDWRHMRRINTIEASSIFWNGLLWIFSYCISFRPWDQTNFVLRKFGSTEKVKPSFLLSLMCIVPETNGTIFWYHSFHLQNSRIYRPEWTKGRTSWK